MCVVRKYPAWGGGGRGVGGYDDIHRPVLTGRWRPPAGIFVYVWYVRVAGVVKEYLAGAGYDDIHRPVLTGK